MTTTLHPDTRDASPANARLPETASGKDLALEMQNLARTPMTARIAGNLVWVAGGGREQPYLLDDNVVPDALNEVLS